MFLTGESKAVACLGAMLSDRGDGEKVTVYSIYDYFRDQRIPFIKADIESFEFSLIKGASNVIRRDHPKLAICIYHNASDMYRIALLIKELNHDYRFAVRQHYCELSDTVLYAY